MAVAAALYQRVIDQAPYDYYGLRAAMHIEDGASATSMVLPRTHSKNLDKYPELIRRRHAGR
jgi:hypothetical protein